MSQMLSTIIITKNCDKTIEACLQSVRPISNEIIILDSGSNDQTLAICRRYTDHVESTDWPGFGPQKQRALDKAKNPWVLSIDADEVLSAECQQAIINAMETPFNGYKIRRLMIFAGQPIYHSGCSDQPLRLFKRSCARFSDDLVHESVLVDGAIGTLSAPMLHYSYANIGEWIAKMNLYSELGANAKRSSKGPSFKKHSITKAIFSALLSFIKMYFFKKGFLDGRLGFVAAINSAVASYYKYLKLALDKDFKLPST